VDSHRPRYFFTARSPSYHSSPTDWPHPLPPPCQHLVSTLLFHTMRLFLMPWTMPARTVVRPPWYCRAPLRQGVGIILHSLTNYINGHIDVLMGAVILLQHDAALRNRLAFFQMGLVHFRGRMITTGRNGLVKEVPLTLIHVRLFPSSSHPRLFSLALTFPQLF